LAVKQFSSHSSAITRFQAISLAAPGSVAMLSCAHPQKIIHQSIFICVRCRTDSNVDKNHNARLTLQRELILNSGLLASHITQELIMIELLLVVILIIILIRII
jgi:hypothetical protein